MAKTTKLITEFDIEVDGDPYVWRLHRLPQWSYDPSERHGKVIAARHMGLEVLGISCISNMAAGVLPQPLRHDEVLETTARVRGQFLSLLEGVIERL